MQVLMSHKPFWEGFTPARDDRSDSSDEQNIETCKSFASSCDEITKHHWHFSTYFLQVFIAQQHVVHAGRVHYCFTSFVHPSVKCQCHCFDVRFKWKKREQYHSSFLAPLPLQNSSRNPLAGTLKYLGWEKFAIFAEISVYLGNSTRQAHGYYGSLIRNHRQLIDPCQF